MDEQTQGVIVRDKNGRFLPGTRPANLITSDNARSLGQKRAEKAARMLRERIAEETRGRSTLPIRDGAEAVAEAGALIWAETVLGEDVYPRDRLAAWETIGKHAGVLSTDKPQVGAQQARPQIDSVVMLLVAHAQPSVDVIEITSTDEEAEAQPHSDSEQGGGE